MTVKQKKNIALIPYYDTDYGQAFLGDSLEIMKQLPDSSVNLILTSPPFALTRQKEYGNKLEEHYIGWFLQFSKEFHRLLKNDGSLVIDLGGAYLPGHPVRSIYQYELLVRLCREQNFFLAQEFFHYNPARLPTPAEWVTVRRIRVKDSVNVVWWLSKSEYPKSDNRKVLKPYSDSMKALLKNGYKAQMRPSGHDISEKFKTDNGGAIPPNLLGLANTESNSQYMRRCKELEIKSHPARFPKDFADFFIKFTTNRGDLVLDPFAGSNTTGYVAELLNRKWIAIEINEPYLEGSKIRFEEEHDLFYSEHKLNDKAQKV
ncbi:MAG: site-specific DNA-methyltransferase [Deltaproteobacteria bacterium]|nr:site-specific DNA-methyltransferase [Deltaproteobacteria bacterium]